MWEVNSAETQIYLLVRNVLIQCRLQLLANLLSRYGLEVAGLQDTVDYRSILRGFGGEYCALLAVALHGVECAELNQSRGGAYKTSCLFRGMNSCLCNTVKVENQERQEGEGRWFLLRDGRGLVLVLREQAGWQRLRLS